MQSPQHPDKRQYCGDEDLLPYFDTSVEEQQRDWNLTLRQADISECPGKARPMQQAEGKGNYPWVAISHANPLLTFMHDLYTENIILKAMAASTGRDGTLMKPGVASPRAILWAMVNVVIVFTSIHGPRTINSKSSTNIR